MAILAYQWHQSVNSPSQLAAGATAPGLLAAAPLLFAFSQSTGILALHQLLAFIGFSPFDQSFGHHCRLTSLATVDWVNFFYFSWPAPGSSIYISSVSGCRRHQAFLFIPAPHHQLQDQSGASSSYFKLSPAILYFYFNWRYCWPHYYCCTTTISRHLFICWLPAIWLFKQGRVVRPSQISGSATSQVKSDGSGQPILDLAPPPWLAILTCLTPTVQSPDFQSSPPSSLYRSGFGIAGLYQLYSLVKSSQHQQPKSPSAAVLHLFHWLLPILLILLLMTRRFTAISRRWLPGCTDYLSSSQLLAAIGSLPPPPPSDHHHWVCHQRNKSTRQVRQSGTVRLLSAWLTICSTFCRPATSRSTRTIGTSQFGTIGTIQF